ncbi:MAG: DegT/DnrJ/EryC1/StrS family aminotransferase, partial [Spirochaetes bacterium]|nr:DegT/DnrJ/EryC1/StrS family aminotransferase [Spirochaetota bacterium]
MKILMVDLKAQYRSIQKDIDMSIKEVIENTAFINGSYLTRFEESFARLNKIKYCIGTSNGTSSLVVALKALGIGQNDEVITVPNTFIATTEAITLAGGKIKLVDVDERSFNMDPSKIEKAITKMTKAIIVVQLFGQIAQMDRIKAIARKHKIKIIEDCAQAHIATYKGKSAGTIGDIGSFSFFPGKNLGCYGDGGAVITNDPSLAKFMRLYVDHGREKKYVHIMEGFNFRLDALQANILNAKLAHLKKWTKARQK